MNRLHIDGDFPTGKECKHHCSPSCHPMQVGPEWVYGCTHPAWPQNRHGDFVPIVDCGGDPSKCDLCKTKLIGQYIGGMKRRIANAEAKAEKFSVLLMEAVSLRREAGTSNVPVRRGTPSPQVACSACGETTRVIEPNGLCCCCHYDKNIKKPNK